MSRIFEIIDKTGRKIHLSKERWTHIRKKHPEVKEWELIKETIEEGDKIIDNEFSESIKYFYKFYKHAKKPNRCLCVVINYLNGKGYVLTAYFTKNIKW